MALLKFSRFAPDLTDLNTDVSDKVQNVFARADGYGPIPSFSPYTQSLPGTCRGYFEARNADGSVAIFAGTLNNLYKLNNTTLGWQNVSLAGGPYTNLLSTDNWEFVQYNQTVLATQIGAPTVQQFNLISSTTFTNLAGGPPPCTHIAIINQFVVLTGISNAAYRVQWSGLGSITTWDNVSLQSGFQDLADGGLARRVTGTDTYGIVFQDSAIRLFTFAPGAPYTFFIQRLAFDDGLYTKYAAVRAGEEIHFVSPQGFKKIVSGGQPQFIGKEKVDRSFFNDVDTGNLQLLIGAVDPTSTRVYWAYKSLAGSTGLFDSILIYDRVLDTWSKAFISGEYIAGLAKGGLTLEALDTIAPGVINIAGAANNGSGAIRLTINSLTAGLTNLNIENTIEPYGIVGTTEANGNWRFTIIDSTHVDLIGSTFVNAYISGGSIGGAADAMTIPWDEITSVAQTQISLSDNTHSIGFLTGPNLEAIIETTETDLGGVRTFIGGGIRMFTDATAVFGSLLLKDNPQAASTQTAETAINALGICPQRAETRYARARMRIPAGTSWTYAMGVEPIDSQPAGKR